MSSLILIVAGAAIGLTAAFLLLELIDKLQSTKSTSIVRDDKGRITQVETMHV